MDMPPESPIAHEQVIEQKLQNCGLNAEGITVRYDDYFEDIEIVIARNSGASTEKFDCIREVADYEAVLFEDAEMQRAYNDRSFEIAKPRMLAEIEENLKKRGLLEGFPERKNFTSTKLFAEALESHCNIKPNSFLVESEFGLIFQPIMSDGPPSERESDQMDCLLNAMMYANLKSEDFKMGFIGNEEARNTEGE